MLLAQSFPFFGFTFHQSSSQIRIQVHDEQGRWGKRPKRGVEGGRLRAADPQERECEILAIKHLKLMRPDN